MLADLLAEPGVTEIMRLDGLVGVMALHGGLEAATAELAAAVADRAPASRYIVTQPDDLRWHVPSTRYDPRDSSRLFRFLTHVRTAVSIHGFGRAGMENTVLIGGRNRQLALAIGNAISGSTNLRVVTDLDVMPSGLRGTNPRNPVNLSERGGVQLELSQGARDDGEVPGLAVALADVLAAEQRSLCLAG